MLDVAQNFWKMIAIVDWEYMSTVALKDGRTVQSDFVWNKVDIYLYKLWEEQNVLVCDEKDNKHQKAYIDEPENYHSLNELKRDERSDLLYEL